MISGKSQPDLHAIEESARELPRIQPRKGLKDEMLTRILAEARREEEQEQAKRKRRTWRLPSLRFTLSLGGMAMAVMVMFAMLPDIRHDKLAQKEPQVVSGSFGGPTAKEVQDELAYKKAIREQDLIKQVIPHNNGQFIGEGVEITINDSNTSLARKGLLSGDVENDYDVYRLVQELYVNGGQLVAINGIQVDAYTKIITKGTLMQIQERRVTAPYTLKVIGDSEALFAQLSNPESVLADLRAESNLDIVVERSSLVTIDE